MARPVHFEIPAEDVARARKFFETVFGWTFTEWGGGQYWLITTGAAGERGIDGGLMQRRDPAQPLVNTIEVTDLEATAAAVEANGGKIVVPKMPIPGVGWLSYFKDTEGIIHGIMQPDPKAGI